MVRMVFSGEFAVLFARRAEVTSIFAIPKNRSQAYRKTSPADSGYVTVAGGNEKDKTILTIFC